MLLTTRKLWYHTLACANKADIWPEAYQGLALSTH